MMLFKRWLLTRSPGNWPWPVQKARSDYVARFHKAHENRFMMRSLDQSLPGRPNSTFGDTIAANHEIWR